MGSPTIVGTQLILLKTKPEMIEAKAKAQAQARVSTNRVKRLPKFSQEHKLSSTRLPDSDLSITPHFDKPVHDAMQIPDSSVTSAELHRRAAFNAYQDSRSDIQKMAERRGVNLRAQTPTKYDEFQIAAERAVIPDCLAKGTSSKLGLDSLKGLLVVPALAVSAIRGKCK